MKGHAVRVRCLGCGFTVVVRGELGLCPECQRLSWAHVDEPLHAYKLSENDRRFLKTIQVDPEV